MYQFSEGFCYVCGGLGGLLLVMGLMWDYLRTREHREEEIHRLVLPFDVDEHALGDKN